MERGYVVACRRITALPISVIVVGCESIRVLSNFRLLALQRQKTKGCMNSLVLLLIMVWIGSSVTLLHLL